jgi:hypothetical protein
VTAPRAFAAVAVIGLGALSCGPKVATQPASQTRSSDPGLPAPDGAPLGGTTYGGMTYGGVTYAGAAAAPAPQGGALTWTVRVTDDATSKALPRISVTAVEQTWDCKTRVLPDPRPNHDHHHGPPPTETYDCKGGTHHVTKLTDASGAVTFQLPHAQYELGPIKHLGYFPSDFPDPMYQRIVSRLVKTTITNGGAGRFTEYRLFPHSALKVTTEAQAEALALQNPIVKKCVAQHPQLTRAVEKPSLMWRVQFLYAGAKNLEFLTTVDAISGDVGFMGCWEACCAGRAPSRFERRLTECAKLRGATADKRKPWDCDTLAQDFVRLQDFYRRNPNPAEQQKYEELYRAYEAGEQ